MYNIFRQVIPRINDPYNERIFVAIYNGNFYIELIIVIDSSSITLQKSSEKSEKGRLSN